jgi:hypothetical protein
MKRRDRVEVIAVIKAKNVINVKNVKRYQNVSNSASILSSYVAAGEATMSFDEALNIASRDEAFKATIYAINTLLIHKGIYTQQEFQDLFVEWVGKEERKKQRAQSAATPSESALV